MGERVNVEDLVPGRNYIIRRLGLIVENTWGVDPYVIYAKPYNSLYWITETEDLGINFVRNVRWDDIPNNGTIRSNVHPDDYDDNPLVSEFTAVGPLGTSPRFFSKHDIRFITTQGARIEFYNEQPPLPPGNDILHIIQGVAPRAGIAATFDMPVNPYTTIADIKRYIRDKQQTLYAIRIIYKGNEITDNSKTIRDLQIDLDNKPIYFVYKPSHGLGGKKYKSQKRKSIKRKSIKRKSIKM
jgi:hypothetical protein